MIPGTASNALKLFMTKVRFTTVVLLLILLGGLALRLVALAAKSNLIHDEAISYLSAAGQEDLCARPQLWMPHIKPGSLYISQISYASNREGQQNIIDIISQQYNLRRLPGRLGGLGEVYQVLNPR